MAERTSTIRIPPRGKRGQSFPGQRVFMRVFRPILERQVARYGKTASPEQPRMMGFPVLLLTTVGARTGKEHTANRRFRARVESLQGSARDEAYARISAAASNYASYPKKTDREIPVLRETPAV